MVRKSRRSRRPFTPQKPPVILFTAKNLLWILLLVSLIGLIAWLYFSQIFTIKKILCLQGERPCSEAIEAELASLIGTSILTFRPDQLEKGLTRASITTTAISVKAILPDTIKVQLQPRSQTVTIAAADSSSIIFVDENLVPFQVQNQSQIPPTIISSQAQNLTLGEQINNPILVSAVRLVQTLNDHFISFHTVTAEDNRLQVLLKNNVLVLFPVSQNFSSTVTSLQAILQEATISSQPKQIDLRFDKPVLRF